MKKRILTLLLAVIMTASLLPMTAWAGLDPVTYLDWDPASKKLVEKTTKDYVLVKNGITTFENGKTYVVADTVATGSIAVNGTATLILCDGAKLTATGGESYAGIEVTGSNALTICGQKLCTGELIATGGGYAAGIGGSDGDLGFPCNCGSVTVNGGIVTATGIAGGSAGIGGGDYGKGGTVVINNGVVTACASATVGIGHGYDEIEDGTITVGDNAVVSAGDTAPGTATTIDAYKANRTKYVKIEVKVDLQAETETAGDLNGSGDVTIEDAVLLCQYLAGWDVKVDAAADCSGDGIVDIKDAVLLSQFLAGMKVTFGSDDPYRYISDVEVPIDDIFGGDN